jgi:hypothetical protein
MSSPLTFRLFCATYPQAFAQAKGVSFRTISALFPHVLHMFSMKDYGAICVAFFRNDFGRNPQVIADAAGEKNGEKKAVDGSVWKSGFQLSCGAGFLACATSTRSAGWKARATRGS